MTYKLNIIPVTIFCNWLKDLLNRIAFDIILEQFNINAFDENAWLAHIFSSYDQIVKESTHISGSLLDIQNELSR